MRIKVHLRGSGILPFDYHYHLSSAMYKYKEIANRELSARLHYSKEIKTFTFSEIQVPKRRIGKRGIEILDDYAYIIYSSPNKDYVEAIVEGMLSVPELRVGALKFTIESVEVLPVPQIDWGNVLFKTLSPVAVHTFVNGKKVPLYPTDPQWYTNIEKNIKHQYEKVYGEKHEGRITVETLEFKPKKYEFKKKQGKKEQSGAVYAVHGHFRFKGEPELIKFAYEAGIGERGAQGFGCLKVAKKEKK